jgi:hypothetical protein
MTRDRFERSLFPALLGLLLSLAAAPLAAQANTTRLPPLKKQPTPAAVVAEHNAALRACDWQRLMAQYPANAEVFLPGGQVIKGREKVADLFRTFVKPFDKGGLCGIRFEVEHTYPVENTLNVQWVATAPFLAAPYRGADAYVTKDGLMAAMVTTFDGAQMKTKK